LGQSAVSPLQQRSQTAQPICLAKGTVEVPSLKPAEFEFAQE